MKQSDATFLGFCLAPLVPAVVFSVTSPGLTDGSWPKALAFVPIFYAYALISTGVFGVPLYLAVRHWWRVTWWSALMGGAAVGTALTTVMQATASTAIFGAGSGAAEALAFWTIWRLGREPTEDEHSP